MPDYRGALTAATGAALEAGALLRQEFHRPGGPRGKGGDAPIDREAEHVIRERLLAACPWRYLGEETGEGGDPASDHVWVVDPNDATASFLKGFRGSAVSIAALRDGVPILGVVYAYSYPDDAGDLIAWAEGCGPITRNGYLVEANFGDGDLGPDAPVILARGSDWRADSCALAVAPSRFLALPTIAYRLALVAVGEAVAAVGPNSPRSWDYAAGHALLRAAGGVLFDEEGRPPKYDDAGRGLMSWCFAGAPKAVARLLARSWRQTVGPAPAMAHEPFDLVRPRPGRTISDVGLLARAQGAWLGQLTGDALGALVEFRTAAEIAGQYPQGVRHLKDGGTWNTLAGQPTDDSELALMLARTLARDGRYEAEAVRRAYVHWAGSRPFDMGAATHSALVKNAPKLESQANGSLMRSSSLGIFGAGRPEQAAAWAREDSGLTHPNPICREACAAYVAALATAVAGGSPAACLEVALREASRTDAASVREALDKARVEPPADFDTHQGWVLIALQNAFFQLLHAESFEDGIVATVMAGGDTDTNAAIAGALLGAVFGRDQVPAQWRRAVLTCRPLVKSGARQPRPREFWAVDALALAEALLLAGRDLPI